jgi:hypothetical protein
VIVVLSVYKAHVETHIASYYSRKVEDLLDVQLYCTSSRYALVFLENLIQTRSLTHLKTFSILHLEAAVIK